MDAFEPGCYYFSLLTNNESIDSYFVQGTILKLITCTMLDVSVNMPHTGEFNVTALLNVSPISDTIVSTINVDAAWCGIKLVDY